MRHISIFRKGEAGIVLVYVILAFALALLVIPSILSFGFGAHRTAELREQRMQKVYAADAGIEDAFYRLKFGNGTEAGSYTIPATNGYSVNYEIKKISGGGARKGDYEITSTASSLSSDFGGSVTIVTHTGTVDYKGMFDSVITVKNGTIDIANADAVYGNITLNGQITPKEPKLSDILTCSGGTESGLDCIDNNIPEWPTKEELGWPDPDRVIGSLTEDHYWTAAVAGNTSVPASGTLTVRKGDSLMMGPCHTTGSLTIGGQNKAPLGNLTLLGNLYVEGDLTISANSADQLHLYLGNRTIYVEGELDFGQGLFLHGPGVIAAVGTVKFAPNVIGSDGYIFVISISGDLRAQPGGTFMGAMAGVSSVNLQPGVTLTWVDYPKDPETGDPLLDFPGGGSYGLRIEDYIILP